MGRTLLTVANIVLTVVKVNLGMRLLCGCRLPINEILVVFLMLGARSIVTIDLGVFLGALAPKSF